MRKLLKNCRIVSPNVEVENGWILIDEDEIESVSEGDAFPQADEMIDAAGMTALPGFIDIHSHGAMGHDVTTCGPEGIRMIAEAKTKEGVTTWIPTTLTLPEKQLAEAMRSVAEYMDNQLFAKTPGVHLEGPFVNSKCAGAQNPDFIRPPDIKEVLRLNEIAKVAIVTFAPEMDGSLELAAKLAQNSIVGSCGHSAATREQILAAKLAGACHLTHFCNQMSPLHHRDIGMVGSGLLDDDFFLELICDKIHVSPAMVSLIFKSKKIDSVALITDSVGPSWLPDGDYEIGGLPITVSGGEARLRSNGALAGSTLKYNIALRNAREITGVPLSELVKTSSFNQAARLGLKGLGEIKAGFKADLALLDDDFNVRHTFVDGKRVYET
ncbi:MAG: N-acetylglucosamine-6-phosphate deacetylase [Kiritimatiellaeota bacterium]|nr:N-acetylglucosamine-6-phosphate deacetylase [Kiritimatiellota bacterium]